MIIFGIDPGTNRTGWGVITKKARKNEELHIQYVGHGCIVTEKINTMPERLLLLHTNLNELVKKHKPNCLIVENIFFGRNVKTAISVSQARGVIMLTAALFDLPVFEYTPSTVKLSLTGSGKTEKKGVQYGRNDEVTITKGSETQTLKYKKAEPLLTQGWTLK
jgi:crossover junction endodeoxyribonuclease RuvC